MTNKTLAKREPEKSVVDTIREKIESQDRLLAGEKAALEQMAPTHDKLFQNGATEEAIIEHEDHARRIEVRIRLANVALQKLQDELAVAEAAEAEAARLALRAKADGLKRDYERSLREADALAQQIAVKLRAAASIEQFFESVGLNVAELQEPFDDRPRDPGRPAHVETILEQVICDDPLPVGFVGARHGSELRAGVERVMRERQVVRPYRPAQQLPPLESLLNSIRLPGLMASAAWHWGAPKPVGRASINDIYSR